MNVTHYTVLLFDLLCLTHSIGLVVKISKILESPAIVMLLFLLERGEVRYREFSEVFDSRGTISNNLNDLEDEGLIKRRIVETKPAQSYYSLTDEGREVAQEFDAIRSRLSV